MPSISEEQKIAFTYKFLSDSLSIIGNDVYYNTDQYEALIELEYDFIENLPICIKVRNIPDWAVNAIIYRIQCLSHSNIFHSIANCEFTINYLLILPKDLTQFIYSIRGF